MSTVKLTKSNVEAVDPGSKDIILRDTEIKGFLCKITPKGRRAYMLYYRTKEGQERRPVIGVHGAITAAKARAIAQDWKAIIAHGGDPSADKQAGREAPTMENLCRRYVAEYAQGHKKANSLRNDVQMMARFIVPALGSRKVAAVTADDIGRLHNSLRDTPYQANRVLALLSKMFSLAEVWEIRPNGSNPTQHIQKFPEEKRERYLTEDELRRLGEALSEAEWLGVEKPQAIAAIRLLLFTGCRLNEILTLRWEDINWEHGLVFLRDAKTGAQYRPVGMAAIRYLESLPWRDEVEWVIPGGKDRMKPWNNLGKFWRRIREQVGLEDIRIHDLRHTHASMAAGMGLSLPMIGRLLGHTQAGTTQRYAHLAADPVRAAADSVADSMADQLGARNNHEQENRS